jgi:hypothetical protein
MRWRHAENAGKRRPETFDFLTFTHICVSKPANGRFILMRLTVAKCMRATVSGIRLELLRRRHEPIPAVGAWLRRVVRGDFKL